MVEQESRRELADFLKKRRARLPPTDFGFPAGNRRRTPGLRREEVAALAGVGLTWYTNLEQGKDIRVSTSFLENLARALKFTAAERAHLFALAHHRAGLMVGGDRTAAIDPRCDRQPGLCAKQPFRCDCLEQGQHADLRRLRHDRAARAQRP